MEQNNNQQPPQFRCSGDCFKCIPMQRQYCAAQWSYNSLKIIESMQETLKAMSGTVEELKVKIESIQGNEAMLFNPMAEEAISLPATEESGEANE